MNFVVSTSPGRLRVRHASLKNPDRLAAAENLLRHELAPLGIEANPRTGSLLLRFDAAAAEPDAAKRTANRALNTLLGTKQRYVPARSLAMRANRIAKFGMLGSLGASLLFAAQGRKRLHIVTGIVFVGFLAVHMGVFRRHLLR